MNTYDLDTPVLLVDLDRLERNIAAMSALVQGGGKRLRPHTKTHKTVEIARMQIAAGATGLTVAKLGEAEVLADAGITDIFIANEIVGALKMERLVAVARRAQIRVGVDSTEVAFPIAEAALKAGAAIGAMIEVDSGLGRAGTRSLEETLALASAIAEHPGIAFCGIFTHEGHLYRGKDGVDAVAAHAVAEFMRETADALARQGTPAEEISVGSTPGAPLLANEQGLTEIRPGVYVFCDRSQARRGSSVDQCALTVLATVVSVRSDGTAIIDAGSKSLASDCPFADRTYGEFPDNPDLVFASISEEHGHLRVPPGVNLSVGDRLRIIPNHACTCVNMHDTMTAVRGERVEEVWRVASRGRIQ